MIFLKHRLAWINSGLFWRTFFLLGFLITICMMVWVASLRIIERTPKAQQMAAQIISVVTITRAALTPERQAQYEAALQGILQSAQAMLAQGADALDVVTNPSVTLHARAPHLPPPTGGS